MKISTKNLLRAMRLYGIADDNTPIRALRKVSVDDEESFVRASFVFENKRYMILYGLAVDEEEINELWPNCPEEAVMLPNPLDDSNFTTPFHGKYLILFNIPSGKQRLDVFLADEFDTNISRSLWQKYIKAGYVEVEGKVVISPKAEIMETDDISVNFPSESVTTEDIPTLYEDDDVIVVNKPAGVLTHAKGGIAQESTVADFFRNHSTFATDTDRAGIVHRLDRDTSGVLVGARTEEAAVFLQKQFANRTAKKVYIAIVEGAPKLPEAKIDLPIGRHPSKPSTFRVDPSGKSAETAYKIIAQNKSKSLVMLEPKTGRTHQLRVHMAYIGTPIVGDRVYGKPGKRLKLHAYKLRIVLSSGAEKQFIAPIPEEFLSDFPDAKI